MLYSLFVALLAARVSSTPIEQRATAPTVTIKNGTVVGSSSEGVDSFKGIPFAQPPTGNLRLRPPQSITSSFGTITVTSEPTACPQMGISLDTSSLTTDVLGLVEDLPLVQTLTATGEDCLTVNVQRPSTATKDSKLPVLFWIFGGGFESGSTQTYDATDIILKSITLDQPIVYVSVNYRLNGFGFLAGKELADEHATNLGLRDQRLGLQWVQENVAAFGGDPDKVTIWGESAGSISVFDQLIINGGDNTYDGRALFRGAIMDSGSSVSADPVTAPQAQAVYDAVVAGAGCTDAANTVTCLRQASYETFSDAVNSVPGIFSYRSLDLSYLPRPDPGDDFFPTNPPSALSNSDFAKVPIIIGDQEDEGTLFSLVLSNITTNADLIDYVTSYFPDTADAKKIVTGLVAKYPNAPLVGQPAGSPFDTGALNNIYPQFKRVAAILGDLTFTLTRRLYLQQASSQVKSWSYLNSYFYGTPVLGTFHGTDLLITYGTLTELPQATSSIQTYYINFVYNLDPNDGSTTSLVEWPQYTPSSPNLLNFNALNDTVIPDTFRKGASEYLSKYGSTLKV